MLLLLASPGGESGRFLSTNVNASKVYETVNTDDYNYMYSLVHNHIIILLITTIRKDSLF